MGWGFDIFEKFDSVPTSKSFQSNATKFLHPGLHIEPNTDQLYLQKSTWFLFTSISFGSPVSFKVQLN